MSDNNDFDKSLDDLHVGAGRITKGLEDIVSAIDQVASDNAAFIKDPDSAPEGEDGDAIRALLTTLRAQITNVVDYGRQFEERITEYSTEIVELNQKLETTKTEAMLDPITGIGNRRRFENSLKDIVERVGEFNHQVAVLLADIDNFKAINDTLGHATGDQVLKLVAQKFVKNLKGGDEVARWGGDEFAAILPATNLNNAYQVAENVRKAIDATAIKDKTTGEVIGKVSLSVGVASYRQGDNPHKLIFRADQALYEAKNNGRNKTMVEKD